ncbi:MAG: hypothetical protein WCK58_17905, partial [Chloroflexota bacterium]
MVGRLDLDAVQVRGRRAPVLVPHREVDALETSLGVSAPAGYKEYITRLGDGCLFTLLRVLPPAEILARLDEHRGQMSAFWFWDPGSTGFGQLEAMTSIPVADTLDGTVIAAWPSDPVHLFVLDRDGERVIAVEADILLLAEWICTGGLGHSKARKRIFEPMASAVPEDWWDARETAVPNAATSDHASPEPDLARPPAEVLLACFAELEAAEVAAIEARGGPSAFEGHGPEPDDPAVAQAAARFGAVRRRYCSPGLARALGDSAGLSSEPPHGAETIRVLEEERLPGDRIRIRAAHGREPYTWTNDYTLGQAGGERRIIAERMSSEPARVVADEPSGGAGPGSAGQARGGHRRGGARPGRLL